MISKRSSLFILFFGMPTTAFSAETVGRFTLGLNSSTERFTSETFGSSTNDSLYSSQRFYFKAQHLGEDDWNLVVDLRNKYDSFDKLNKTEFKLDAKNEFQFRELSLKKAHPDATWIPQIGRFNLIESGGLFVDGMDNSFRLSKDWNAGFFAGLNPKKEGQSTLSTDSNAQIQGIHISFQDSGKDFDKNFYLTHGLTQQTYFGETERQFLYHNMHYQWRENSTLSTLAYVDFKPRTYFQAAQISYKDQIGSKLKPGLEHLELDVVEYQRRQNVLERLSPSPYKESTARLEYVASSSWTAGVSFSAGSRSSDALTKNELVFQNNFQNFINRNWDAYFGVLSRKNFTSTDQGFRAGVGFYTDQFESTMDYESLTQKNDDTSSTNPTTIEVSGSMQFSKQYFVTASVQNAKDENVNINSFFIKMIYRFGTKDIPPLRDGAAPRGAL